MDKINESSQGGNLSGWNGELHDISRILTGDWGNPLQDVEAQMARPRATSSRGTARSGRCSGG
jgi:hypothetical protein